MPQFSNKAMWQLTLGVDGLNLVCRRHRRISVLRKTGGGQQNLTLQGEELIGFTGI